MIKINKERWIEFEGRKYYEHCYTNDKSEAMREMEDELELYCLHGSYNSMEAVYGHSFILDENYVEFYITIEKNGTFWIANRPRHKRPHIERPRKEVIDMAMSEYFIRFIVALQKRGLLDFFGGSNQEERPE